MALRLSWATQGAQEARGQITYEGVPVGMPGRRTIDRKLKLAMTRSIKTGRQVWLWIDEGGHQHATFYYRHGTLIARICGEEIVWA